MRQFNCDECTGQSTEGIEQELLLSGTGTMAQEAIYETTE